jgi:hypothetical protein
MVSDGPLPRRNWRKVCSESILRARRSSACGARVLRVIDGGLTVADTGGERSELIPVGADTFQFRDGYDRLQLARDASGAVTALPRSRGVRAKACCSRAPKRSQRPSRARSRWGAG